MSGLIEQYKHNNLVVKIWYDTDLLDDPTDWGNYTIVQFRDNDFTTYENIEDYQTESGKLLPGVQSKMRAGKMFTLVYRRYSNADDGYYSLDGGIPVGVVDSQEVNGFIIFDDAYVKNTTYAERRKYAEQDLKTYTEWSNGEVYGWTVETPDGEFIDSCGGYIVDFLEDLKTDANNCANNVRSSSYAKVAQELHA